MTSTRVLKIGDFEVGGGNPLFLIAGPCVIESEEHCLELAARLKEITDRSRVPLIFKASFDKANRTAVSSYRGPGLEAGLRVLDEVRRRVGVKVLSDIHEVWQAAPAAEVLDVIQIPAFLCRQTDLLLAAAATGKVVNIKKGQFLSPWDIRPVIEKFTSGGSQRLLLTERGTSFGYNNLVVDFKSLPVMRAFGFPVVFDATHSVQLPGGAGQSSAGQAEFIAYLARAAAAVGVDGLFCEVHEDPARALSDGPNALQIDLLSGILDELKKIDQLVKRHLEDGFVGRNG